MQNQNFVPETPPRVRFAPSPTGELHIGSSRTALFNYLFARRYNGAFILRIEDTDKVRSTEESLRNLVDGLSWLGITWDEGPDENNPTDINAERGDKGPYIQSARSALHLEGARKLKDSGHAYHCVCPPLETTGSSKCRCYEDAKKIAKLPDDQKSLKFHVQPGPPVVVHDLVRGEVMFRRDDLQDFIILRADGYPTYNFVVTVDDAAMGITHVIRGDDHLSNTPKQVLIYEALGLDIPAFAHIPLIHGSDGTRMSKRHGTVSVQEYRDKGFLPQAFVNYLALLGWNEATDRDIYSMSDLEKVFSLGQVSSSPASFDMEKLVWFNGKYIREFTDEQLYEACLPFLRKYVDPADINESTRQWLTGMVSLYRDRLELLSEIEQKVDFYFTDPKSYEESLLRSAKVDAVAFNALIELKKVFSEIAWNIESIEKAIHDYMELRGLKPKSVMQPLRLVLSGVLATPGIFETIYYIGQEAVIRRMEYFLANYRSPS